MSDILGRNDEADKNAKAPAPPKLLRDLAVSFLRLGLTAFGGPAAHIAMMDEEFVGRRRWLTREEFLDMLGASNLIPGPSSTEMAIHVGHRRAGWRGLVTAGTCFIIPAMLLVMACAWAYVKFGSLPQVRDVLYGVKPVIIAVILNALWRLARTAVKSVFLAIIGALATGAAVAGANVLVVLFAAGLLAMIKGSLRMQGTCAGMAILPAIKSGLAPAALAAVAIPISLSGLFLLFLKFGSVIFGGGYVLLAFLQADLVSRLHWMTQAQLLDAVAVGQLTPGPVFTTATFIGYLLGGVRGAVVATAGIFLPGFVFVAASRPLIPRIRHSKIAAAFLDGVNVGAVALMIAVTWQLSRAALVDFPTGAIAALSAAVLIYFRINSAWLIFAGGLVGLGATQWLGA
jgi:chromate transporter